MPLFGLGKPNIEKMTQKRDVKGLCKALRHKDELVRRQAARALGESGDARAVEALITALKDKNETVRYHAVEALGKIGDTQAVGPLLTALKDTHKLVRSYALEVLVKIGGERAVEALITALKDADRTVRRSAALALGESGDARAVEPLIACLKDNDKWVRRDVANALGKIGDERAVGPLISLAQHDGLIRGALHRFDYPQVKNALETLPLRCAKCNRLMQRPPPWRGPPEIYIGTPEALASTPLECPDCHGVFCTSCAERVQFFLCPRCWETLLDMVTKTPVTCMPKATHMSDEAMLSVLRRLCNAYMNYDDERATIADLEPLATEIGWELHRRGGIQEMRRIFQRLGGMPGSRTLEMHWGGIGDWRG